MSTEVRRPTVPIMGIRGSYNSTLATHSPSGGGSGDPVSGVFVPKRFMEFRRQSSTKNVVSTEQFPLAQESTTSPGGIPPQPDEDDDLLSHYASPKYNYDPLPLDLFPFPDPDKERFEAANFPCFKYYDVPKKYSLEEARQLSAMDIIPKDALKIVEEQAHRAKRLKRSTAESAQVAGYYRYKNEGVEILSGKDSKSDLKQSVKARRQLAAGGTINGAEGVTQCTVVFRSIITSSKDISPSNAPSPPSPSPPAESIGGSEDGQSAKDKGLTPPPPPSPAPTPVPPPPTRSVTAKKQGSKLESVMSSRTAEKRAGSAVSGEDGETIPPASPSLRPQRTASLKSVELGQDKSNQILSGSGRPVRTIKAKYDPHRRYTPPSNLPAKKKLCKPKPLVSPSSKPPAPSSAPPASGLDSSQGSSLNSSMDEERLAAEALGVMAHEELGASDDEDMFNRFL